MIEEKREQGFNQVSLTMDSNRDYNHEKDPDKDIQTFIVSVQLVDPFYDKFKNHY